MPTRRQIPPAVLKVITHLRISPAPKGGYEPIFTLFCGGRKYESKDMIPSDFVGSGNIDIPVPDLAVIDEASLSMPLCADAPCGMPPCGRPRAPNSPSRLPLAPIAP